MKEYSREYLPTLLQDISTRRGVKYLVLDLDDTLVDTLSHYQFHMKGFARDLSHTSSGNYEEIYAFMRETLNGMRPIYKVNPMLMEQTAKFTTLRFGLEVDSREVVKATANLMRLYETPPPVFEGVHETLDVFAASKMGLAIFTHSDEPWASAKLAKNGLYDYFRGNVFAIPSWGVKGREEWMRVYESLGIGPSQVFVGGDSWWNDVRPNIELGVPPEHIFRVRTEYGNANLGRIEGVGEIESLSALPMAMIERFG